MANFEQAIKWMREGKKVARLNWVKGISLHSKGGIIYNNGGTETGLLTSLLNIEAIDWEIYGEEKENLSKKRHPIMKEKMRYFYYEEDVGDSIKKIKDRIAYQKNTEGIHNIIEEEMGKQLLD